MSDKYWWFEDPTVKQLGKLIAKHPGARLEVRIDEAEAMTLTVCPKTPKVAEGARVKAAPGPVTLNFSHVCPPQCG